MADERIIQRADLKFIEGSLGVISSNLAKVNDHVLEVDNRVEDLNQKHDIMKYELDKLIKSFNEYVGEYRRKTELQLANTQIIEVRQELETKYGYYGEVRRMATGILQGVDSRLITNETLQYTTEEVMIKAPGYWLAPTLLGVACWLRNDKETSERAVKESIRRDDYKTTLFFMLLCRRINRLEAVIKWVDRYFLHQNPRDLDREFVIILESISTGVFPPTAKEIMIRNVKEWVIELTQTDDFIDQQKDNWINFFAALKDTETQSQYPVLQEFAINWANLEVAIQLAKSNKKIFAHFGNILTSGSQNKSFLIKQLDELLNFLVTNFDDEELPLRKRERLCELIIEKKGDLDAAQALMDTEQKIFDEKVDFLQMLTNAAFNPEKSGASSATQALAVSISQPWIIEAFNSFVGTYRLKTPSRVEFDIDGFIESTADGSEEESLLYKQDIFYEEMKDKLIAEAKFPWNNVVVPALISIFGIFQIFNNIILGILLFLIGGFWIFRVYAQFKNYRNSIEQQVEERKQKAAAVLRSIMAETVEYRSEYKKEDQESDKVLNFLDEINSDQFMSLSSGVARSIIN